MTRLAVFTGVAVVAALLLPAAASGQESNLARTADANPLAPIGWSITPSLTYSGGWDDNVLMRGAGDTAPPDFVNVVNPRASIDYNSSRGQLSASYDGAFLLYRDLNSLNSYDQHAWIFGRQMLSRHVALFVSNTAASVPTTEYAQLVAIPFVRTGSRLDAMRGGIEIAFTKRTSMAAGYMFEWVDFDSTQPGAESLQGGHSHGASVNLRHAMSPRLTVIADYDLQHAIVRTTDQAFDVQNGSIGIEYKLSDVTRVSAAGGISHLGAVDVSLVSTKAAVAAADGPLSRTGPAIRLGLARHFRTADLDLGYSRSFVPSYGFGGTMQNEEADARVRIPLARRVYTAAGVSWRSNDPVVDIEPPLQSTWIEVSLGYALAPWAHLEAFYAGAHQTIDRPGGVVDRNRFGFQIVTTKPMRIH